MEQNNRNLKITRKRKGVILWMTLFLAASVVAATAIGAVPVPISDTARILLRPLGLFPNASFADGMENIIFYVRFPRVLVAVLVGAALSASGCVMQGMFRNPMADPGVIGLSSGAGLGAVVAVSLGLTAKSMFVMPFFAIAGAILAAFAVYFIASRGGKIPVLTLILSGIAVNTFLGSLTSLVLTKMNESKVTEYLFWAVGSLGGRRWEHVMIILVPIVVLLSVLFLFSRDLNILLLGEEESHALGLDPTKTRRTMLLLVSITTAMAVSVSGSISFVGLIVPHIIRLIVGPDHRILLPASALAGAIFMVVCDLIARTVMIPAEIGVGIVTSLLGAPYFIYLLNRARKEGVQL